MSKRLVGRLTNVAALAAAAIVLSAPGAALAQTGEKWATVSPGTVAPGGSISVTVNCQADGDDTLPAQWGMVNGNQPDGMQDVSMISGQANFQFSIPSGTAPGQYEAGALCPGDSEVTRASFTVAPGGAPRGGTGLADDTGALAVAGAGTLAVAGATGAYLLVARRRSDAPVA